MAEAVVVVKGVVEVFGPPGSAVLRVRRVEPTAVINHLKSEEYPAQRAELADQFIQSLLF